MRDKANGSAYTDRMWQWDYEKYNELCQKHFGDKGQTNWLYREPKAIEAFIRDYNDDQTLILTKVVEYCNASNGYPVWNLIWYKENNDARMDK